MCTDFYAVSEGWAMSFSRVLHALRCEIHPSSCYGLNRSQAQPVWSLALGATYPMAAYASLYWNTRILFDTNSKGAWGEFVWPDVRLSNFLPRNPPAAWYR